MIQYGDIRSLEPGKRQSGMIKATEQPHNAHKMFRVALRSHGEFGERRDVLGGDLAVSD